MLDRQCARLNHTEGYLSEGWSFKEGRKGHESLQQKWEKRWKKQVRGQRAPQGVKDMAARGEDLPRLNVMVLCVTSISVTKLSAQNNDH